MKDMLIQLENNEAVLLMYLAGELPAEERAQVELLLSRDKGMRATYEELRADENAASEALKADATSMPLHSARCVNQTIKAMRQWQESPPAPRFVLPQDETRLLLPWWSYPLTAAASVLIAAAVFFANIEPASLPAPPNRVMAGVSVPDVLFSPAMADFGLSSADAYALAEDLAASFDESSHVLSDAETQTGVVAAKREVASLEALSQDAFASVDWQW